MHMLNTKKIIPAATGLRACIAPCYVTCWAIKAGSASVDSAFFHFPTYQIKAEDSRNLRQVVDLYNNRFAALPQLVLSPFFVWRARRVTVPKSLMGSHQLYGGHQMHQPVDVALCVAVGLHPEEAACSPCTSFTACHASA